MNLRNLRRISQLTVLILFVYIFLQTRLDTGDFTSAVSLKSNMKAFFAIDPLHAVSTLLSAGDVFPLLWFSLITVGITLLFGRVFCGWFCPFGTLHHITGKLAERMGFSPSYSYSPKQRLKYYILVALLVSAIMGVNLAGYMDPLSLLVRSLGSFFIPLLQWSAEGLHNILGTAGINADPMMFYLADHVFGTDYVYIGQAFLIGLIFLTLLGMNFIHRRFWCRFLCPLGALLGLISKFSLFRIKSAPCSSCGKCLNDCEGAADPMGDVRTEECLMVLNCLEACPESAIGWGMETKPAKIDLSKRHTGTALLAGFAAAPLFRLGLHDTRPVPGLIRPPGALAEKDFLDRCVRCEACIRVCPENFLQPALLEGRLEGLWTPIGNGNTGYCEYSCNICAEVCPTGAIELHPVAEKKKISIGTAFIDPGRCLPFAFDRNCIVCEEHCPTPEKAIIFRETDRKATDGQVIKEPVIVPDLCIGCAICQAKCPVVDSPAIYVTSVGETRDPDNRMLPDFEMPSGSPYG
ncbi:4Fe-4S dicluster domain-containing protein [Limisalsivibrio acetivorans]|uniref:4Fe-4S dicluster domain-containing protein n=1 Tax=Limisalsivibrio acetivorans TaxID=1304888 RepID=UPI0003B63E3D|nr:4Fe-4S dicluster domain-containing protein [Limisalsivibrio acetivorans]